MGVKKSAVCRSRPPPNGTYPASSLVSIPLTKPSTAVGASPLSACSRSPGANFDAQPALVEYFVSLMRARSSIAQSITRGHPREPAAFTIDSGALRSCKRRGLGLTALLVGGLLGRDLWP
jgi:hypothetical protein